MNSTNGRINPLELDRRLSITEQTTAPRGIEVIIEPTTSRTLSAGDVNKRIFCTNVTGCAVTVPDAWPAGDTLLVQAALAAGAVTIVRAAGMAFESVGGNATKTITAGGEACVSGIDATAGATIVSVNGALT